MKIYRHLDEILSPLKNPVVTIGNFDGVHKGHLQIFKRLETLASEIDGVSVVITFDPHPLKVLRPEAPLKLINTLDEKISLIQTAGIDCLIIIPFDLQFASIPPEFFVEDILVEKIGMKKLVIGYDYAFGKNRQGGGNLLKELGRRFSYDVEELSPISTDGTIYSSSLIRKMVSIGEVSQVIQYLGRHFSVAGKVVYGERRGRTLGFPTANIDVDNELIPAEGVYAVKIRVGDNFYDAACNIGRNPTFDGKEVSVEVFIFDFDREIYGERVRVYFIERIRTDRKFESVDELKKAINTDVVECKSILKSSKLVL